MTKATVAFRNSENASSNYFSKQHERGRTSQKTKCSVFGTNWICRYDLCKRHVYGSRHTKDLIRRSGPPIHKAAEGSYGQSMQNYTVSGVTQAQPQHAQRQEASADGRHDSELKPETGCTAVCVVQASS